MPARKAGGSSLPAKKNSAKKGPEAVRSFERSLPMLLMRAREAVMMRFRPHLRSHEITEQQWRILRVLAEEKNTDMLALSVRCSIQPPSLSRTIPLLVERGLVRRCSHGNDQRRIMVDLTPQGRALFRAMLGESGEIYRDLQADIGEAGLAHVYQVLDELIEIAERRKKTSTREAAVADTATE